MVVNMNTITIPIPAITAIVTNIKLDTHDVNQIRIARRDTNLAEVPAETAEHPI